MTDRLASMHNITVRDFLERTSTSKEAAQQLFRDAVAFRNKYGRNLFYTREEYKPLFKTARDAAPHHDEQQHPNSVEFINRITKEGLDPGFSDAGDKVLFEPHSFQHLFCHLAYKLVGSKEDPNTLTIRKALAYAQAPDIMLALLDFAQPCDLDEKAVKGAVDIQRAKDTLKSLKAHARSFYQPQ